MRRSVLPISPKMPHLIFTLSFFFLILRAFSAYAYDYDAGSLVDSARRSRSLLETYSNYMITRFNIPDYWTYTRPDWAENNHIGIYPALNKPFSAVKEDYFYYYSRGYVNNIAEAYLGKSIFVSEDSQLLISRWEARAATKTNEWIKTALGDFGVGFNFFWEGYNFGQVVKYAKNPAIGYDYKITEESMLDIAGVNDFVVSLSAYLYPHLYISYGVIINHSTLYSNSELTLHHFIDTNWLGVFFLQGDYSSDTGKANTFSNKIELFNFIGLFTDYKRTVFPDLYLGYSYLNSNPMAPEAEQKTEQTLFAEFFYNYLKAFTFSGRIEFYISGKPDILMNYQMKELCLEAGINHNILALFFGKTVNEYYDSWDSGYFFYYLVYGISRFTDERLLDFGSPKAHVWGHTIGIRSHLFKWYLLELYYQKNYSRSLKNIVESYDFSEYTVKFSMYF